MVHGELCYCMLHVATPDNKCSRDFEQSCIVALALCMNHTHSQESSSRPVTTVTVPGSSAVTQPGGGGPPYGPPTRPPIASPADHSNIYISVSVIVIVLIIVSGMSQ